MFIGWHDQPIWSCSDEFFVVNVCSINMQRICLKRKTGQVTRCVTSSNYPVIRPSLKGNVSKHATITVESTQGICKLGATNTGGGTKGKVCHHNGIFWTTAGQGRGYFGWILSQAHSQVLQVGAVRHLHIWMHSAGICKIWKTNMAIYQLK